MRRGLGLLVAGAQVSAGGGVGEQTKARGFSDGRLRHRRQRGVGELPGRACVEDKIFEMPKSPSCDTSKEQVSRGEGLSCVRMRTLI